MNECYLKNCSYHSKDEPFCTMDVCLMSDTQLRRLELARKRKRQAGSAVPGELGKELYDDSDK